MEICISLWLSDFAEYTVLEYEVIITDDILTDQIKELGNFIEN